MTYAETGKTSALVDAVYTTAMNAGISWGASKKWRLPVTDELLQPNALPYLCVMTPSFVGWDDQHGAIQQEQVRTQGLSIPVWDIGVYGLWPFADPKNDLTYSVPQDALDALIASYTADLNLGGACFLANIHSPSTGDIEWEAGQKFAVATLTIRAYIELEADY